MSRSIQRAPFFSVMVDETTDAANIEQVVICLRWVSETLAVHEDCIGLYEVASTGAETIYFTINVRTCSVNSRKVPAFTISTMLLLIHKSYMRKHTTNIWKSIRSCNGTFLCILREPSGNKGSRTGTMYMYIATVY